MSKCLYCGTNLVSHKMFWFMQTMTIILPNNEWLYTTKFGFLLRRIGYLFSILLLQICLLLRIARFDNDINKVKYPRTKVLWEEAIARNIKMENLFLFGLPTNFFRANIKGKEIIFETLPRPKGSNPLAILWMDDKFKLKRKLEERGLPVPKGESFSDLGKALNVFNKLDKPVIVKPRLGSRGRHTTTFIYTEDEFKKAFRIAKQLCYWVIVEEQIPGPVFRGTVIGGKVVGVLGGSPPSIAGDGVSTIAQLIEQKNKDKDPRQGDILVTQSTKEFLVRQNLKLESVLPDKKVIDLTEKIGVRYGGTSFEVIESTHPDTLKMLAIAGETLNDPILGFDFILEDISRSYKEQKCGIIECNAMPFINLHHDPLYGHPVNAAGAVWDLFS